MNHYAMFMRVVGPTDEFPGVIVFVLALQDFLDPLHSHLFSFSPYIVYWPLGISHQNQDKNEEQNQVEQRYYDQQHKCVAE